jgi:hypothetical protein
VDSRKVLDDWLIATQETISILQNWVLLLDEWRNGGPPDPGDFAIAVQQLREAGLGRWADEAGGHGLAALARTVDTENRDAYEGSYDHTEQAPTTHHFAADHLPGHPPADQWSGRYG